MSKHRFDTNIDELKAYFNSVIDWVSSVFEDVLPEMKGQEWGDLYARFHTNSYNPDDIHEKIVKLDSDPFVLNKKGMFEYVLGNCEDTKLLNIRVFDDVTKKAAYNKQTQEAKEKGVSNCPLCALGNNSNKTRIYELKEMDADHVTAWSKGGSTSIENCEMLCSTHNRAKGNR